MKIKRKRSLVPQFPREVYRSEEEKDFGSESRERFLGTWNNNNRDLVEAYAAHLAAGDGETLGVLRGIRPYTASTTLGGKGRDWSVNIWALPPEEKASGGNR